MHRKLLALLIGLGLLSSVALAEENYAISGEVTFSEDGTIYICILTKEKFRDFHNPGYDLSASQCKVQRMNADLKSTGIVFFKFDSVPKGTYCIVAYQDVNNNGKVDFKQHAISEPLGSYREFDPSLPAISWQYVKFDLEKDITGIKIQI
jgi:uncharacterized protein (DUF2141 family)